MDLREFAFDFQENIKMAVEMGNTDYDQELASAILEYLEDNGEVNVPELCVFQKTRTRITAYDYNDEAESLDLFYLIKAETLLGKVNKGKIDQGFNYLMSFYRESMNGTLLKSVSVGNNDEIAEVAKLVQSTKGKINQLRLYVITNGLTDPDVGIAVESDDGEASTLTKNCSSYSSPSLTILVIPMVSPRRYVASISSSLASALRHILMVSARHVYIKSNTSISPTKPCNYGISVMLSLNKASRCM